MKLIPCIPGVVHVEFPSRLELTLTMCRLQEFYESPYNIKGEYFSMEKFIETYAKPDGTIDYFNYWAGFNVPAEVVKKFKERFGWDYTVREVRLIGILPQDFKYLIAVDVGQESQEAFEHELAHAKYAIDVAFKDAMQWFVDSLPEGTRKALEDDLMQGDYPNDRDILTDEIQAYLLTSDDAELDETFPSVPDRHKLAQDIRALDAHR